jgi:hypothetical protein
VFRPSPFFLAGVAVSIAFWWFGLAGIEYRQGVTLFPYRTAGWFVMGSPFILGFSVLAGMVVAKLARRRRWAGGLVLVVGVLLTVAYAYLGSPGRRVREIIGPEAVKTATIEELRTLDSFNGGETTCGIFNGPEILWSQIGAFRGVGPKATITELFQLQNRFPDAAIEAEGPALLDERGTFYHSPKDGRVYFIVNQAGPGFR